MERTKKTFVYLSEEELQRIRIAAAHAGATSLSEYGRTVLLAAASVTPNDLARLKLAASRAGLPVEEFVKRTVLTVVEAQERKRIA